MHVQWKYRLLKFSQSIANRRTIREAAEDVGVSYGWARRNLWPSVKQMALADFTSAEEKENLAQMVVESMIHVLLVARDNVGKHAAYGAVVVAVSKEMREIFGIDLSGKGDDKSKVTDMDALGEEIRAAMPTLIAHHEHIARIKQRQLERQGLALSGEGPK